MSGPVLITGAAGLLGGATARLMAGKRRVFALTRRTLDLGSGVETIVHDLKTPADPVLPEPPETIVHLAQSSHHKDFPGQALDVFEVNTAATQRLLDLGRRLGARRFVYASSGGVYGHGDEPFSEDAALPEPPSHYVATKRAAEHMASAYAGVMTVVILRFFFIYGPGQREDMLIPRLIASVRRGAPITLQGTDGLRINPVHVDDGAIAVERAAGLAASHVINVAGPGALTLREIGTAIGDACGHQALFETEPAATPRHLVGGIQKMCRLLSSPRIGLADGVRTMHAATPAAVVPGIGR